MFKNKSFLPWIIVAVAVIAVAAILLGGAKPSGSASTNTATVTTVTYAASIEASGYIQAQPHASLVWRTSGIVASIPVSVGDQVMAGDVLMSLQTTSASPNVIVAQADLINAQNQLDALTNPGSMTQANVQRNLANAWATWETARNGLASALSRASSTGDSNKFDDVTNAETDLSNSLDTFALTASPDAQWYYWAVRMASLDRIGDYDYAALASGLRSELDPDDADLVDDIVDAQIEYETAVNAFAESITDYSGAVALNDAVATYRQSAETLMEASQTAYETLITPNPGDLDAAQARVDAAQATIDMLSIIAPFEGEILTIEQHPGDVVSVGAVALYLADRSNLYVDVLVDEADIALVAVGNPATITMDAMPDTTLNGTVTFINPVGEMVAGLVKYHVRVELAPVDDVVLLGATADVTIQVSDPQTLLAVPASAVQSDNSGEYVTVIGTDGSSRVVPVQSGESVGSQVIVSGDLQEGDRVQTEYDNNNSPIHNPFGGN